MQFVDVKMLSHYLLLVDLSFFVTFQSLMRNCTFFVLSSMFSCCPHYDK